DHLVRLAGGVPAMLIRALEYVAERGGWLLDVDASGLASVGPELPRALMPLALAASPMSEALVRELMGDEDATAALRPALVAGWVEIERVGAQAIYRMPAVHRDRLSRAAGREDQRIVALAYERTGPSWRAAPWWLRAGENARAVALLEAGGDSVELSTY